jgi:hypothetical protein
MGRKIQDRRIEVEGTLGVDVGYGESRNVLA